MKESKQEERGKHWDGDKGGNTKEEEMRDDDDDGRWTERNEVDRIEDVTWKKKNSNIGQILFAFKVVKTKYSAGRNFNIVIRFLRIFGIDFIVLSSTGNFLQTK